MIGTDLTSISTNGWFTEETLSDNLTPVSTFGWYYFDTAITPVSFSYSFPVEKLKKILVDNSIPIEVIGDTTLRINKKIPIEIFGKTQFWTLDRRGILWTIDDCGELWIRDNNGSLWKIEEGLGSLWTLKERN